MRLLTGTPRHRSQAGRPAPSPPASDPLLLTGERASADSPRPRRLHEQIPRLRPVPRCLPLPRPRVVPAGWDSMAGVAKTPDGIPQPPDLRLPLTHLPSAGRVRPIPGHSGRPALPGSLALCGWFCHDVFLGRRRGVDRDRGCIRASPKPVSLWPVTPASVQEARLLVHGSPAFPPELFQHFRGCRRCGAKPAPVAALPNPLMKDDLPPRRAGHRAALSDSVPSPPLSLRQPLLLAALPHGARRSRRSRFLPDLPPHGPFHRDSWDHRLLMGAGHAPSLRLQTYFPVTLQQPRRSRAGRGGPVLLPPAVRRD